MFDRRSRQYVPYVTIALAGINILVFVVLEMMGSTEDGYFMYRFGALYGPAVRADGEYWRLLTAMFLHFGVSHLMNNLLMMIVMGMRLEAAVGRIRCLILYLASGIGANLFTLWYYEMRGIDAISAGASGALMGMIGALFACALRRNPRIDVDSRQLLILIGFTVYSGFISTTINQAAHISGLAFGFLLGLVLQPRIRDAFR